VQASTSETMADYRETRTAEVREIKRDLVLSKINTLVIFLLKALNLRRRVERVGTAEVVCMSDFSLSQSVALFVDDDLVRSWLSRLSLFCV
jgi:hypothetical protein